MARIFSAAFAALLILSIVGCGSDEPALKEMTDAERQEQIEKQRAHQIEAMKGSGQMNQGYQQDAMQRDAMGS